MRLPAKASRRRFLARATATTGALALSGCDALSQTGWFRRVLATGETLSETTQKLLTPRKALAQEFSVADRSPEFRHNGSYMPDSAEYEALAARDFVAYRLQVGGLVGKPASFSLAELRALPSRTQTTRHDCIEGWSAIGTWKGAKLSALLDLVEPRPEARYVMFYCADTLQDNGPPYYESIDFDDAFHPQTILAYELNDRVLPIQNGAPIRLRVERQLGYKHAKYIMRIELVERFDHIAGGTGGFWEDDQGYEWYAGI